MATIATRLTNTGNLLVNGTFDEYTYALNKVSSDTVYTAQLDEVTGMSASNGLIFYIDPGKTASYPGTGTKINDIQTTTTVGTTQASPTFTSTAPGYFTLNGTSQYIDFGNVALAEVQDKTAIAWIYITSSLSGVVGIIDKEFDNGGSNYGGWGFWAGPVTGGNGLWFWAQGSKDLKDTTVLSLNTWYHVAVVWNYTNKSATFFVNGVQKTTQTDATIVEKVSNSTTLKAGAFRTGTNFLPGRYGAAQVYNRQLSAAEILNNYNADAARYGYTPTATVPVQRKSNAAVLSITGVFDELTGAPVIDGNLQFYIDAAQTNSYPGSGATWYDISTNQSNVTLFGSPTFSSSVTGGNIKFVPGSTQYGNTSANLGNMPKWTAEAWVKVNATLTGQVTSVVTNQYNLSNALNYSIGTNKAPTDYNLCVGFFDGAWHNTTGFVPALDTWYQVVGTYDGTSLVQYVNGTANGSAVSYTGTASSGGVTRIARRWDDTTASTNLFPGDIAVVRIYNRALTADEVSQNFNAHRRRFNI